MTPNTMTLDEVRDELARRDGWVLNPAETNTDSYGVTTIMPSMWTRDDEPLGPFGHWHPHPATLDGAAAALLTEYVWGRYIDDRETENGWYAWKRAYYNSSLHMHNTDDEILDRYRLALACRIAEEGK